MTNRSGRAWSGRTDETGTTRVSLPPGQYDVETGCPDAPHHVTVTAGATARSRFDYLAP